jgi:hypothetical protein
MSKGTILILLNTKKEILIANYQSMAIDFWVYFLQVTYNEL